MPHIPIFFIVMCVIIMVHFGVSGTKRAAAKKSQGFWDRENEANNVRRADISKLPYLTIDAQALPLDEARSLDCSREISVIRELTEHPERRILNLSMYTNTDLKSMYGPANLPDLSFYDENFTSLIRSLNRIGVCFAEAGDVQNAKRVFEYAVSCGSDFSVTDTRPGEIYADAGETEKIDGLLQSAESLQSLSAPVITNKLNSIKNEEK